MTMGDLAAFRGVVRTALRGNYRGYGIVSMPPPSSGGVTLIEMLNILEGFPLAKLRRAAALRRDRGDAAPPTPIAPSISATAIASTCRSTVHLEGLRRALRAQIGQRARRVVARAGHRRRKAATPRISPSSTASAMPSPTPIRSISATASVSSPTAPGCCSRRARRFHRRAGHRQRLRAGRRHRQPTGAGQTAIVVDDADDRAQGWQAGARHRLAGGSRIITAVLQVIVNAIDFRKAIGERCAHRACTISGCPTRPSPSPASIPICSMRCGRAAALSCRPRRTPRPIRSR